MEARTQSARGVGGSGLDRVPTWALAAGARWR